MNAFKPSAKVFTQALFLLIFCALLLSYTQKFATSTKADGISTQALQTIDLSSTTPGVTFLGASDEDHLGSSGLANTFSLSPRARALAAGDFNKDGIQDLAIGAPEAEFTPSGSPNRSNAGAVYILFGRGSFTIPTLIDTNTASVNQPDVKIYGAAGEDNLGFSLAVGDINGDGADDLLMGAPGVEALAPLRNDAGAVYVLLGSSTLVPKTIDLAVANSINVAILGAKASERFGSSIAVGDVGGATTIADILVGAPNSKGPANDRTDGGAAYLLYGGTAFTPSPITSTRVLDLTLIAPNVSIYGVDGSLAGSSVAIGNVNATAPADIVIGAPKANRPAPGATASEAGAALVVYGGDNLIPTGPTKTFDIALGEQSVSIYGATASDHLGTSVAAGDVTGDGFADILIGAPDADGPADSRMESGEAYVITGSSSLATRINVSVVTVNLTVYGEAAGDHLGSSVSLGRLNTSGNTDAISEFFVGSPAAQSGKGSVSAFYGGSSLTVIAARDLAIGQDDLRVIGKEAGDELGWAVIATDLDNNRGGDLVLSAPFSTIASAPPRPHGGRVYVLFAANDTVPPVNIPPLVQVTSPNGAENLNGGTNFNITWTASDANGDNTIQGFEIRLSIDGGANYNTIIASNLASSARTFNWNVNGGLNTTTARIRVIATDDNAATGQDDSNANFSITDPGVTVHLLTPNGGDSLKFGQTLRISWEVPVVSESQVKGFDIFLSTDGGTTFNTAIAANPLQPALGTAVRTFDWVVPRTCATAVRVLIVATSNTGARSSDSSDSNAVITDLGPTIDTSNMAFDDSLTRIALRTIQPPIGNEIKFAETATVEISSTEAGTTFFGFSKPFKYKKEGRVVITKGLINNQELSAFFPDNAIRILRVSNPPCGTTVLKIKRQGAVFVLAP